MSSSSGIWSELERSQFEEGVVQFGWGKWVDISKCIPSRHKSQVKSHAQKLSIHRKKEVAELLKKHAAAMKEGICGKKPEHDATTTPVAKNARRPSRSSIQKAVTTKSVAPTPVKVRRSSKSSIETPSPVKVRRSSKSSIETPTPVKVRRSSKSSIEMPTPVKVRRASKSSIEPVKVRRSSRSSIASRSSIGSAATVSPKLTLVKGKKQSKDSVKEPTPTKIDTPKEPKFRADQISPANASELGAQLMELEISPTKVPELRAKLMQLESSPTKSDAADKPEVHIKLEAADKLEMRFEQASSFSSVVTPSPSFMSNAEDAEEVNGLMANLDYFDALDDDCKGVEDDSFALDLEDDILDIKLEEEDLIPGTIEYNSVAPDEQQIRSRALMHLRLQVQPNEGALDEITAILESPPDSPTSESKSTLMRQRIIRLATEASDVGWWRESEKLMPEVVQKAHLEHLVALTFAVLQADAWKRFSEDIVPGETRFNAQDDIRHICQLLPGIWNRVNHSLARDSYALFGAGIDQLERSHAVNKMVRMFDGIPYQSE